MAVCLYCQTETGNESVHRDCMAVRNSRLKSGKCIRCGERDAAETSVECGVCGNPARFK